MLGTYAVPQEKFARSTNAQFLPAMDSSAADPVTNTINSRISEPSKC